VLKNLGMFAVWASAPFVKALLAQPEVAEAMPTRTAKSPMIRPVKTRPAP
jgi:hypothetical protein